MATALQNSVLTQAPEILIIGQTPEWSGSLNSSILVQRKEQYIQELINCDATQVVPHALIIKLDLLTDNNFELLTALRKNIFLRDMPIIAFADDFDNQTISTAVAKGLDDCYTPDTPDTRWPEVSKRIAFLHKYRQEMQASINSVEVFRYKVSPFKRLVDISIASAVLLLISPILILVAIAIRIESKGAILYRSKRAGTGYEVFDFLKFRSMYADADQRIKELNHLNQYDAADKAGQLFVKFNNDPRVTKVGRFIRKTSIDELPQLINVLKGDMSIVGNRPLPLYEAEMLTRDGWAQRFLAPAGLTGLWQVSKRGKNDMSAEERIGLDIQYSNENSFWYDMNLLVKTPMAMIQEENV